MEEMTLSGNIYTSVAIITQANKDYSYPISDKEHSIYHPRSSSFTALPAPNLENQESNTNTTAIEIGTKQSFCKRVLIVDDDPDLTLTFKVSLDGYHYDDKTRFEVYTYNDPLLVVTQFKPNFYDLLLTDIYMPHMNGFELSQKILEIDVNIRVCFISSAEINIEALREVYPRLSFGCFIKKPVTIEYLVKRLLAELD